jgi:hypothetical protein
MQSLTSLIESVEAEQDHQVHESVDQAIYYTKVLFLCLNSWMKEASLHFQSHMSIVIISFL